MQVTEELKAQLETQVNYCMEQAQVGERAVEHNRSQSIIMDELRHRAALQDELVRQKDRQVAELIAQRDESEYKLYEFRGSEQQKETRVRGLEQQRIDIQQQLVSAVSVGQAYHAEAHKLKEKAVRTKEMLVRRIISQWLYESVSQAFYGWSSLIGGPSQPATAPRTSIPTRSPLPPYRLSASVSRVILLLYVGGHKERVCDARDSKCMPVLLDRATPSLHLTRALTHTNTHSATNTHTLYLAQYFPFFLLG